MNNASLIDYSSIKTALDNNKNTFLDLTHQLNNYNEIYNVNSYLKNMNALEYDRLSRTNENIKAKVLKMKQEYLLLEYGKHENKMRTNIMLITMVIVSIISVVFGFYCQDKLDKNMSIMIAVGILIFYFLIILFILKANAKRRKYDWNQYYWLEMKKKS